MQLIFSLAADGRVYPDAHDASGNLDKDIVGPLGLVQILETQLGMLAPSVSKAVRISTYLAKLRSCGGGRFWASSFSKDPWSTAATHKPNAQTTSKLLDMTRIEQDLL